MEKLLLTPEDAAEVLSLSRTRVYELMVAGLLGSVKIGNARRVPADSLRDYVEELRGGSVARV